MGKVKAYYSDHIPDEAMQDYYIELHKEELIKEGKLAYQLKGKEEIAQDKYMKGDLCTEQTIVPPQEDMNSKPGQLNDGLKLRKPRLKGWVGSSYSHYGITVDDSCYTRCTKEE